MLKEKENMLKEIVKYHLQNKTDTFFFSFVNHFKFNYQFAQATLIRHMKKQVFLITESPWIMYGVKESSDIAYKILNLCI